MTFQETDIGWEVARCEKKARTPGRPDLPACYVALFLYAVTAVRSTRVPSMREAGPGT